MLVSVDGQKLAPPLAGSQGSTSPGHTTRAWARDRSRWQTEVLGRDPQAMQREVRIDHFNARGEWRDQCRKATGRNHAGTCVPRPFCTNPTNHAVHRVGRSEQHASTEMLVGAPTNCPGWSDQFGRGEFRGASYELFE